MLCCALEKPGEMADPVEVYRVCPFLSLSLVMISPARKTCAFLVCMYFFFSHVVNEIGEWGVGFLFLSQNQSKSLVLSLPPPTSPISPHSMVQINKETPLFFSLNPLPLRPQNPTAMYCNVLYRPPPSQDTLKKKRLSVLI